MGQFTPYMPETWQSDGMLTYHEPVHARPSKKKPRGAAWTQVLASSAMGIVIAIATIPIHPGGLQTSFSVPIEKRISDRDVGRLPSLLAAIDRRDASLFSGDLLQLAERVRPAGVLDGDALDAWADAIVKDVIGARD